jgi:sulfite exporter TauE/SafE/copper chaperone CopZ
MKKYLFHVAGIHCTSCKIYIEDTLKDQNFVRDVCVNIKNETLEIDADTNQTPEELAIFLTNKIRSNNYTVSVDKGGDKKQPDDVLWRAVPLGLGVLVVFFLLQKSGVLNIGIGGQVTVVTSFIIGLIASVSSCLAVVGGLVLSLSAKISQDTRRSTKIFTAFHVGRLVSFAILGGVIGSIGGLLGNSFTVSAVLGLIASAVMVLLGLNLVGLFKKKSITLPPHVFNFLKKIEHQTFAPIILGGSTFFLPCGFTQSMQIAALSSGSFFSGFLIMTAFACGTLPVLACLTFGSTSFARSKHASLFFTTVGVVVIGLGLFSILAGLAGLSIIKPLFTL